MLPCPVAAGLQERALSVLEPTDGAGKLEGQTSGRKGERRTAVSLLLPGEEEDVLQSWGPGALGGDSAEETSPLGAGQGGTRKSSVRVGSGSRATHPSFPTFPGGGCSRKGVGSQPGRPGLQTPVRPERGSR